MNREDFEFDLPPELIAQAPLPNRGDSRLLCLNRYTGEVCHQHFADLLHWLQPGDLLVLNNTAVIPARLYGEKATGGRIELLIERLLDDHTVLAHLKASKAPKPGQSLFFNGEEATVLAREEALFRLKFVSGTPVLSILERHGHTPLPPYITRSDEAVDQTRYQTVFAQEKGAVAAPTAGLHFDEAMLTKLEQAGVSTGHLTLHVGAGTFQPVRVDAIEDHVMHREWMQVSPELCEQIQTTKAAGGRVVAVGTTVVRALETAAQSGTLQPFYGDTEIFIYPGFTFRVIDGLLTNFHLSGSTLLMLVSALAGREAILSAYQQAMAERYRFFSYGDAMLIH